MGTYFSVLTPISSLAAHTIVIVLRVEPLKDEVSYGGKPAVTQYRGRGRLTSDFVCRACCRAVFIGRTVLQVRVGAAWNSVEGLP